MRLSVTAAAFILGLLSLFGVIFCLLDRDLLRWLPLWLLSGAACIYAIYRGLAYQPVIADKALAARLGFTPIEGASDFEAEGLFSDRRAAYRAADNRGGGRNRRPARFVVAACELRNSGDLRLLAFKSFLPRPLKSLPPRMKGYPEGWDDFTFYCEPPLACPVAELSALKRDPVFSGGDELLELEIEGHLLKARFRGWGQLTDGAVRAALTAVTAAAAALDK
jgi:hypothetical protein